MTDSGTRTIELRVSNQKAYVWDVDDVAVLRAQHHICGVLTGTLPHLSQQNVFLGVPLVLMPEEVVLLVQNQLAVLVDDPRAHRAPSQQALHDWNTERIASVATQIAATEAKEATAEVAARSMSEDAIRKRREREERRAAAARAKAQAEDQDGASGAGPQEDIFRSPLVVEEPPATRSRNGTGLASNIPYTVTVPASSPASHKWYSSEGCAYTTLEAAREAGIWMYPSNLHERAKCGVFRGLWEQGFFMGGAVRFGGDFLVYPGDPLRYHSHFVASVIDSPIAKIQPMEIVAHGRLGTATKKAHLLCGWDDEKQEASYYSIEWAGFG